MNRYEFPIFLIIAVILVYIGFHILSAPKPVITPIPAIPSIEVPKIPEKQLPDKILPDCSYTENGCQGGGGS